MVFKQGLIFSYHFTLAPNHNHKIFYVLAKVHALTHIQCHMTYDKCLSKPKENVNSKSQVAKNSKPSKHTKENSSQRKLKDSSKER